MTDPADDVAVEERFLSGEQLYGDDFTSTQIAAWYEDEREASARLWATYQRDYIYEYRALNHRLGFRHLPNRTFDVVLGLGAAYGHEFRPLIGRVRRFIVVEPSTELRSSSFDGVPLEYRSPSPVGDIPCESESIDLVACHGVLHHIPNVSHVVREMARCLRSGGYALIREPIVSMGDWTKPRPGLTKRERGIPLAVFRNIVRDAGFQIIRQSLCLFPAVMHLAGRVSNAPYNSKMLVGLDALICRITSWNVRYHATNAWHKVRPTSVYLVATKR